MDDMKPSSPRTSMTAHIIGHSTGSKWLLPDLRRASLDIFDSPRPVLSQEARQGTIRQEPAFGLAARAVVGFVARITDPLHFCAARDTRLAVSAVDRHVGSKRCDL